MKQNLFALLGLVTVFALAAPPGERTSGDWNRHWPIRVRCTFALPLLWLRLLSLLPLWRLGLRLSGRRIHCTRLQRWARRRAPLNSPGDYAYVPRKNDSLAVLEEEFNGSRDSTLL